jgi:hypothetical protein
MTPMLSRSDLIIGYNANIGTTVVLWFLACGRYWLPRSLQSSRCPAPMVVHPQIAMRRRCPEPPPQGLSWHHWLVSSSSGHGLATEIRTLTTNTMKPS